MILRLFYLFIIFFTFEIGFGFLIFENYRNSFVTEYNDKKNNSDFRAEDIVLNLSRYLEIITPQTDKDNIESYFNRLVSATNKNQYEFSILNIYLLSTDGSILAFTQSSTNLQGASIDTHLPLFMRALRMRRGQVESVIYEKKEQLEYSFFERKLLGLKSEDTENFYLSSAPVYIKDKMEVVGTIHIIYQRFDMNYFLSAQKNTLKVQLLLAILIGLLLSLFLWLIFYSFVSILIRESIHENSYEVALSREIKKKPVIQEKVEKVDPIISKSLDAVYLE
jgi:hypothetical protein